MYKQLRQPNLSVKGVSGFCLNYARRVFSINQKYLTAWSAWQHSKQHKDRKIPNNSVPLWFSYYRLGVNLGHVVISVPGKGIYSSPIGGKSHFKSLAEFEKWASNIKYKGWSEDINGVKVIQKVSKPAPKPSKPAAKKYVVVKRGDTLTKLAKDNKTTVAKLIKLNNIRNPNLIFVGQRIRVK